MPAVTASSSTNLRTSLQHKTLAPCSIRAPRSSKLFRSHNIMSTSTILDPPTGMTFLNFLRTWNDGHVEQWLTHINCGTHTIETFKTNDIRGDLLLELEQTVLKEMGIKSVGDRMRIFNGVKGLRSRCPPLNASLVMTDISVSDTPAVESPEETSKTHGTDTLYSRTDSSDTDSLLTSRTRGRLDSSRPAPLVLALGSRRPDLPRIIPEPRPNELFISSRLPDLPLIVPEPQSGDSMPNATAIDPLPSDSPTQSVILSTFATTRPLVPRSSPASRRKALERSASSKRPLLPLIMPNYADSANHIIFPLSQESMLTTENPSNPSSWTLPSFGLPANPRSPPNMRSLVRSPTLPGSWSTPSTGSFGHNRNMSFNDVFSPFMRYSPDGILAPSLSRTGSSNTSASSYESMRAVALDTDGLLAALTTCSVSSHDQSKIPTEDAAPSMDIHRRKLVKIVMPEQGRSHVINVGDCACGLDVMKKVLKKVDKVGLASDDVPNDKSYFEPGDENGFSVDGWSVYLDWDEANNAGIPLSEAQLIVVCHGSCYDPSKARKLILRKSRRPHTG